MDPGSQPGLVTSPDLAMPGNLDILAQTAASQSADITGYQDSSFHGISVLRLSESAAVTIPLYNQQIRIEGQPGGPMLSQTQIQKILGGTFDSDKGMSLGPLSIIPTSGSGYSDPGQPSPASLSQNSNILQYRQSVTSGDAMLSAINYSDNEMLHENFDNLGNLDDGLLGSMGNASRLSENPTSETFNLFDGEGDSLTMEALSPGLIISDSGGLSVNTVTDSNDSNHADSGTDEKKKFFKAKNKPLKGQVSPGKGGTLECNQCHKVFNNTSALAKHKLTHSDERKYTCQICEKKFKRQDHLNGHLMTHRDKKPYQCMVVGCDKSYCDARSLRRHLENHHQHTTEQIAAEMVSAQTMAAEVLAEVTMPPSGKGSVTVSASTNNNVVKTSSNSLAQNTDTSPVRVVISDKSDSRKVNTQPVLQVGVATTVSLPINLPVNKDVIQVTQSTTAPLETVLKKQYGQQKQEQGKHEVSNTEQSSLDILKRIQQQLQLEQVKASAQFQAEQQQQQQSGNNSGKSSSNSSWQDYKSPPSNIHSPRSGELSPTYTEMSPVDNYSQQQAAATSPVRSATQLWLNPTSQSQQMSGAPPANVTVADAKSIEEMTKPVACNICERRFKNTAALNGHMRLHGGYFKKDASLKEEKKKKGEMAPPSTVPSRSHPTQSQPVGVVKPVGVIKKSKGNPPIQSPPSEELHALHWQQKQQEQQEQQLQQQIHQELQWQLKRQEQEQKQQQLHQELQLRLKQHQQDQAEQQKQQQQHIQQELQQQLKQEQQQIQQDFQQQLKHEQQQIQHDFQQQLKQEQQQIQQDLQHQLKQEQQQHIHQKLQQQLKQQEQQKQLLQQKLQEQQQLQQLQQLQQQTPNVQEVIKQQIPFEGGEQLAAVGIHLAQAGVDSQQIEHIKLQLQQHQQAHLQQDKQLQLLYEQQQQQQQQQQLAEQASPFNQLDASPQVPQSPHLPTSPSYLQSPHIPQSPHSVAPSPLIQRQGSVEQLQSPGVDYNRSNFPQDLSDFSGLRDDGAIDQSLLNDLQRQIQLQSQRVEMNSVPGISVDLQQVSVNSVPSVTQGLFQSANVNRDQGSQIAEMTFNPSVNIHHNNSAFQTQISGPFIANGQMSVEPTQLASGTASNHQTSEIVSQIITSLEDLGEVVPGSMQQIHKQSDHVLQSANTAGSANFHQDSQLSENGMLSLKNNSFSSEFAHNNVVHNPIAHLGHNQFALHNPSPSLSTSSVITSSSSSSSSLSSVQQGNDSRACVKQELLKHLASKPSSPRAALTSQFSFQFNQIQNSLKNKLANNRTPLSPNELRNSEIKRRLSAGPEDYRPMVHTQGSNHSEESRDLLTGMAFKSPSLGMDTKPRIRSKSGDDYNLRQWRNEDQSFMRPRDRIDADFSHRPRSKTDEHLAKWNNAETLSKSDGAGMFRNPTSFAPGSFKIKRKQRPAPLIIPSHANHCGFQSRLRSPRIWNENQDGMNSAPVPYTPPPMLSPQRRGAGLYYSVNMTPQMPASMAGHVNATPSTPRPSLLRSASIPVSKEQSPLLSSSTIPAEEELQPPESDIQPHVNVGSQYQASLPPFNPNKSLALHEPSKEDLIWEPSILRDSNDYEVQCFQDLARSAAVKGNGSNVEYALHLLCLAKGDLQKALLMLMSGSCEVPCKHSLLSYHYQESEVWTSEEIESYTQALRTHDKDFFNVAKKVKTKSVRSCVQFYYLWKKVQVDEHKRLRIVRRRREQLYNLRSTRQQPGTGSDQGSEVGSKEEQEASVVEEFEEAQDDEDDMSTSSSTSALTEDQQISSMDDKEDMECDDITQMMPSPVRIPSPAPTLYTCDYPECNSSFTSKPALHAHLKLHSKLKKPNSALPHPPYDISKPKPAPAPSRSPIRSDGQEETFPCKLCGRVFLKVKSRSAHMKIHRPDQDKEREKKAKAEKQAKAVLEKSRLESLTFTTLNGPPTALTHQVYHDG